MEEIGMSKQDKPEPSKHLLLTLQEWEDYIMLYGTPVYVPMISFDIERLDWRVLTSLAAAPEDAAGGLTPEPGKHHTD
jgi:hypothetical protein